MALILEGPDLCGKTTIAKCLQWPVEKHEKQAIGANNSYKACMLLEAGYNIWDRWWVSEHVYNLCFRNEALFSKVQLWHLGMLAQITGAVLFIPLFHDKILLKNRYLERGDSKWSWEQMKKIILAYEKFLMHSDEVSYLPSIHRYLKKALLKHRSLQERARLYRKLDVNGWGSLEKGKRLLVGDKLNNSMPNAIYPFYSTSNSGCGTYLFESLSLTTLRPSDLHIINVREYKNQVINVKRIVEFLQPSSIVALGKDAHLELSRQGIKVTSEIPHPQYWRRFKHYYIEEYANLLMKGSKNDS